MVLNLEVAHENRYTYSERVERSHLQLCLQPQTRQGQAVEQFELTVEPEGDLFQTVDGLGNIRHMLLVTAPHESLTIVSRSRVRLESDKGASASSSMPAAASETEPSGQQFSVRAIMTEFTELTKGTEALERFLAKHQIRRQPTVGETARELEERLHEHLEYSPGATNHRSPVTEILETGRGVCQDFTHLALATLRWWGIPGRYVSGYHCDVSTANLHADLASHAWAEAWDDQAGWVRIDATNPRNSAGAYVTIGYGRDYNDVPPTRGIKVGSGVAHLSVRVCIGLL